MLKPNIFELTSVNEYFQERLEWLKSSDENFSIRRATNHVNGCSPSLVTQVLQGKRKLKIDKVFAFSKIFRLEKQEEKFLETLIKNDVIDKTSSQNSYDEFQKEKRSTANNFIIKDWLNLYVKNLVSLNGFKEDPSVIFKMLGGIASVSRIEKSLSFLFREGFLRKNLDGEIVHNDLVTTTTNNIPSDYIKKFHKKALEIARNGIDRYEVEQRSSQALLITLDKKDYGKLKTLIDSFYEQLLEFAEKNPDGREELYQVILNTTPVGFRND